MAKQKFKITNWNVYNKALVNRGSLIFWLDESAIQAWYDKPNTSSRGRPQHYSELAISTVLMLKRVFRLTLRAAQGFIDSIFTLMKLPLRCPDCSCVSRRARSVNIPFKTPTRGEIAHQVIDSTGLKVFGEGEWKVKKYGQEKRRIWRKLHLAVDADTHEVIWADMSLNNVTDAEAFPGLIRQTHRKIRVASADGAYDTRRCHDELRRKNIKALIPPRTRAGYWPAEYADRNKAVARQRLTGSNAWWKWNTAYNQRSVAETEMYRVKQLFGGHLTLRDYDAQVGEDPCLKQNDACRDARKCANCLIARQFAKAFASIRFIQQSRSPDTVFICIHKPEFYYLGTYCFAKSNGLTTFSLLVSKKSAHH